MKVTLRLPSKTVQYGFMEVVTEVPDDASPEFLGAHYVAFVASFWTGEQSGLNEVATIKPEDDPVMVSHEESVKLLESELGATVISEQEMAQASAAVAEKPWEKKVDAPAKPWETGTSKPEVKVATVDW